MDFKSFWVFRCPSYRPFLSKHNVVGISSFLDPCRFLDFNTGKESLFPHQASCPLLFLTQAANRHYFFEIQNISCIEKGSEITKLKCSFGKVEKNIYSLNVEFLFVRPLSANAELAMKIHIQSPKSTKVVKFMDSKFNICDTLKRQNVQVPMVRSIFNEILQKSNLPYSCPIGKVNKEKKFAD